MKRIVIGLLIVLFFSGTLFAAGQEVTTAVKGGKVTWGMLAATGTATLMLAADNNRNSLSLQNQSATVDAYCGPASTVTTSGATTGILLKAATYVTWTADRSASKAAWYCISASTANIFFIGE